MNKADATKIEIIRAIFTLAKRAGCEGFYFTPQELAELMGSSIPQNDDFRRLKRALRRCAGALGKARGVVLDGKEFTVHGCFGFYTLFEPRDPKKLKEMGILETTIKKRMVIRRFTIGLKKTNFYNRLSSFLTIESQKIWLWNVQKLHIRFRKIRNRKSENPTNHIHRLLQKLPQKLLQVFAREKILNICLLHTKD